MSSKTLFRLSGIGLLVGGILSVIGNIVYALSDDPLSPLWTPTFLFLLIGEIFMLVGAPGMYLRQANRAGMLGLIGFILFAAAGLILGIGLDVVNAFITPFLFTVAAGSSGPGFPTFIRVGELLYAIGTIAFAIATLRATVLPRWPAILFIVSVAMNLIGIVAHILYLNGVAAVTLYIAIAWFGYALVANPEVQVVPSPLAPTEA